MALGNSLPVSYAYGDPEIHVAAGCRLEVPGPGGIDDHRAEVLLVQHVIDGYEGLEPASPGRYRDPGPRIHRRGRRIERSLGIAVGRVEAAGVLGFQLNKSRTWSPARPGREMMAWHPWELVALEFGVWQPIV